MTKKERKMLDEMIAYEWERVERTQQRMNEAKERGDFEDAKEWEDFNTARTHRWHALTEFKRAITKED